jgi:hypothetical protein
MKNECAKWKDPLLEAALTGNSGRTVCEEHMFEVRGLHGRVGGPAREKRERLDTLLPLVAQGSELSVDFRARVLAAAEATSETSRRHRHGRNGNAPERWRPSW